MRSPIQMKENSKTKTIGDGVDFNRIRRITGYLVGDLSRFNNAKRAEVQDRVKHKWGGENVLSR